MSSQSRREFLKRLAGFGLSSLALPFFPSILSGKRSLQAGVSVTEPSRIVLKGGTIVDGSGAPPFKADLLIEDSRIAAIEPNLNPENALTIDCQGLIISPGFIDMHSHMDWILPIKGHLELKKPYIEQGITTFIAGNCGYGIAGFKRNSPFKKKIEERNRGAYPITWDTQEEYFDRLKEVGLSHNLYLLAGHGTTRTSLRGYNPEPLKSEEEKELHYLLEQCLEMGAGGVSFGLQYEPGIFATDTELMGIAKLVRNKSRIITVHGRAYSSISGTYPMKLFGKAHNLQALEDMISLAKRTGVRLQYSHLIFVGKLTWRNYEQALEMIEQARKEGVDICFDTYPYHCGVSHINVFFPDWFLARIPEAFEDRKLLFSLKMQITFMEKVLGFGYEQIQITHANHPELEQYNGMFLNEIARARGLSNFDNFLDIARKSKGWARVLNHRYSNYEIVKELLKHPASLYMTDATTVMEGVQNPGCYGAFPLILQIVRDEKLIPLEKAIQKMTGASARRFQIKDRGILRKNMAADITVFDFQQVKDNNTLTETNRKPDGIIHVFINGQQVLQNGRFTGIDNAGQIIKV